MLWQKHTTLILDTPFCELPQEIQDMLIYGTGGREVKVHYRGQRGEGVYDVAFEGLIKNVERRYRETGSDYMKQEYESFMQITPCKTCKGQRLKKESLAVTVGEKNIAEVTDLSVRKLQNWLDDLMLTEQQAAYWSSDLKRNQGKNPVPGRCGPGLSHPFQSHRHSFRRRSPENTPGHPDWFWSGGRSLHSGRAQHRPAPERQ